MSEQPIVSALGALARVRLAALPTPLQELPGISAELGRRVLCKRDDLTGLAFGGNKSRELEFLLGRAVADGADVFVAGGGVAQSNHARQCAAAARVAGLDCVLVLRRGDLGEQLQGNLLITSVLGADLRWVDVDPHLDDRQALAAAMDATAGLLREQGRTPHVLHSSVHPLAASAYVAGGIELAGQLAALGIERCRVYATSMGATHVGLLLAARWLDRPWHVIGAGWRPVDAGLADRLATLATDTAALLGQAVPVGPGDFETLDCGGPAYGVSSPTAWDAIRRFAASDALLLDPVYTGKGAAGMLADLAGPDRDPVVFVHTGGLPALFAYAVPAATALELT